MRILWVDDDPREYFAAQVDDLKRELNAAVDFAATVATAYSKLRAGQYEIILVDGFLPAEIVTGEDFHGVALIERIKDGEFDRKEWKYSLVPILMVSGFLDCASSHFLEQNGVPYLGKPISGEQLLLEIRRLKSEMGTGEK